MIIKLRKARAGDAEILSELAMRSKQSNGYDDAFMRACQNELTVTADSIHQDEYWLAEAEEICGFACLSTDGDGKAAEVLAFFVAPDWQGKGIGKLLWEKIAERAEAGSIRRLYLDADPFAVPFYEMLGFKIVSDVPSGSIPGRKLPHMELDLATGKAGLNA